MKKVVGYLLIVIGFLFVAMGLSSSAAVLSNFFPSFGIPSFVTNILGLIMIIVGLYLTLTDDNSVKVVQVSEEVPIYEGEGKERKIVGYKKTEIKKKGLFK